MMGRVLLTLLQLSPGIATSYNLSLGSWSVCSGLDSFSHFSPVEVTAVKLPLYGVEGGEAELQCVYNSVQPVYSVKW